MRPTPHRTWLAVVGVAALACSRTTELLPTPAGLCVAPPGPAVHLGGTDAQSCTGALAARFGRYALCTCSNLSVTDLGVGGPDGPSDTRNGNPGPDRAAEKTFLAAVGTDGDFYVEQYTEIAGTLVTAGAGEATFVHGGHVQGNVRGGGSFTTMTTRGVWVSGDMTSAGDVSGLFKVEGALRVPAGATVAADVKSMSLVHGAVAVPAPPCGCGAAPALDVAAAVTERRARNANTTLSFLENVDTSQTLELPCGEYLVPTIRTADGVTLRLRVRGRAAIFVEGDVLLGKDLNVSLDDGAELDLVVAGSFFMNGQYFGSPATPSRTRLWVGGKTVQVFDQVQFGAVVYAPSAVFLAGPGLTFAGSLYVGTLSVNGDVNISYDPKIAQAGSLCGVAAPAPIE